MGLFDGTPLQRPITCAVCGKPMDQCTCPRNSAGDVTLPRDQPARVQREKRRGKWVTVVSGLDPASDLPAMLKRFKQRCSAGGGLRDDGFELQGDHRDLLVDELKRMGYPAKPAGG